MDGCSYSMTHGGDDENRTRLLLWLPSVAVLEQSQPHLEEEKEEDCFVLSSSTMLFGIEDEGYNGCGLIGYINNICLCFWMMLDCVLVVVWWSGLLLFVAVAEDDAEEERHSYQEDTVVVSASVDKLYVVANIS
jgi:hypothetical protein